MSFEQETGEKKFEVFSAGPATPDGKSQVYLDTYERDPKEIEKDHLSARQQELKRRLNEVEDGLNKPDRLNKESKKLEREKAQFKFEIERLKISQQSIDGEEPDESDVDSLRYLEVEAQVAKYDELAEDNFNPRHNHWPIAQIALENIKQGLPINGTGNKVAENKFKKQYNEMQEKFDWSKERADAELEILSLLEDDNKYKQKIKRDQEFDKAGAHLAELKPRFDHVTENVSDFSFSFGKDMEQRDIYDTEESDLETKFNGITDYLYSDDPGVISAIDRCSYEYGLIEDSNVVREMQSFISKYDMEGKIDELNTIPEMTDGEKQEQEKKYQAYRDKKRIVEGVVKVAQDFHEKSTSINTTKEEALDTIVEHSFKLIDDDEKLKNLADKEIDIDLELRELGFNINNIDEYRLTRELQNILHKADESSINDAIRECYEKIELFVKSIYGIHKMDLSGIRNEADLEMSPFEHIGAEIKPVSKVYTDSQIAREGYYIPYAQKGENKHRLVGRNAVVKVQS